MPIFGDINYFFLKYFRLIKTTAHKAVLHNCENEGKKKMAS